MRFVCAAAPILLASATLWGQTSDTLPPVLRNLSVSPGSVDVTTSPQTFTFLVGATDDLSGLRYAVIYMASPSGAQTVINSGFFSFSGPPLLSGAVSVLVVIPRYAEPGLWRITNLFIYDRVSNPAIYSTAALQAAGFPTTVTVLDSTPDLIAPQLTSISMSPTSFDVSAGSVNLQVDLAVSDATSGLSQDRFGLPDFAVSSPSGRQVLPLSIRQFTLVSGTLNAGVWRALLEVPKFAEAGVWKVSTVFLQDMAHNTRFYGAVDLAAFGSSINLSVASAPQDLVAPAVTGIRFTPSFVNTSLGPQSIQVELDATDDLSGVRFVPTTPSVSFIDGPFMRSPSGSQSVFVSPFGGWSLVSGTALGGTWRGTMTLPQFSEEGTWAAQFFRLLDNARNSLNLNRQGVEALGLTSTFAVIKPSLQSDGTVGTGGGTIQDSQFGTRASITFPPGSVGGDTSVAIDVLQSPLDVPLPTGFSGTDTFFVNIQLNPEPAFPLPPPGLTVVLPLKVQLPPGSAIYLFRVNPATGALEPSLNTSGNPVVGYVNAGGNSVTFTGVSRLSTVVGLRADAIQLQMDIKPGDVVNSINLKSHGVIPVLLFGTSTLDATKMNLDTLRLAGARVASNPRGKINFDEVDYNGDGFKDLLVHFDTDELQLTAGATKARLEGATLDSRQFWAEDSVRIVQ